MDNDTQQAISALRTAVQDVDRRLTRAEAAIEYNSKALEDLKDTLKGLDIKLDIIRQDIAQARGAGTAAKWLVETFKIGGAGGLGAWLASMFGGTPPPGA